MNNIKILAALLAIFPIAANAEPAKKWDVSLGLGAMVRPTYEGSESYTAQPLPYVRAVYDDKVAIGPDGVTAYMRNDKWKYGAGLVYNGGREDKDGGIFSNGDDRLRGMGDVDAAVGAKLFASYQLDKVSLDASATKFLGDDNDGILVELGASRPYVASKQLVLVPHASVVWADENYTQTFFGVTSRQSANSGFAQYDADAGIKHVDAGVRASYMIDQHWFIGGDATAKLLTGDASDSPIVESDVSGTIMSFAGYKF